LDSLFGGKRVPRLHLRPAIPGGSGAATTEFAPSAGAPRLSVVAPCYNEEAVVAEFVRRMDAACRGTVGESYEIILINDGSVDATWQKIEDATQSFPNVVGVDLLRNHGHQLAVTAGVAVSTGERVLLIDADLQDPPELLGDMMSKMDEGYDVIYGQRRKRRGESISKKLSAAVFYRLLNRLTPVPIPVDTGDFRLMTRSIADALNAMPERHRFIRGMVAWIGGRQAPLMYDRDKRYAGETKYTFRKMVRFALDAVTSFSVVPLRLAIWLAFFAMFIAVCLTMYVIGVALSGRGVEGWASLAVIVTFFSAVQLFALGVLGEYVGRAYMQLKMRPMYLIRGVVRAPPPEDRQ
jgi:polyisoprenyl-phosphate glycosyltransferase